MSKQPLGKCKKHPGYLYKQKPRKTKAYPKGCPDCWKLWNEATALVAAKAETGQFQKGEVANPSGKNGRGKDIHHYARSKLSKGKVLVDRLDVISKGEAAGSTVKDEIAATKELYKIMTADQQEDKPQDIRVVVLNLADSSFEEYKRGS